jgi:polysaccharide biosynthesis/export protein
VRGISRQSLLIQTLIIADSSNAIRTNAPTVLRRISARLRIPRRLRRKRMFTMYSRSIAFLGLAAVLAVTAGCSSPGNRLPFFGSGGHRQLDDAKAISATVTDPLALPRELDKHVSPAFIVEPGDVLLVQPTELDSPVRLPGDQAVLPDGTIQLGKYGRVPVAGKTLEEIEALIKVVIQTQTKDAGPVTVRVVTRQSKVYYVLGEVNAPGAFTFNGRETALDAILAAGGLTDRASRAHITLSRPTEPHACRIVLPICYSEIVQLGDTATNYQIQAGDRIYVPTKTIKEEICPQNVACPTCSGPQTSCYQTGCPCQK